MNNRLELLSTLGRSQSNDEQKKRLTQLVSDLKIANTDRNTVIHGVWSVYGPDGVEMAVNCDGPRGPAAQALKRRLNNAPIMFSASKVLDVAGRLCILSDELLAFVQSSWPDTWQRVFPQLHEDH